MKLITYLHSCYWRRLIRLCLGFLLGLLTIVGWVHPCFSQTPSLVVLPEVQLPAPQLNLSLNGTWQFLPDPDAKTHLTPASPVLPPLDWAQSQSITVPSNWYTQGHDLSGVVWYRHRFKVDASLADQDFTLIFEGVDYAADVWLNDRYLGLHEGYFQAFRFQVSDSLKVGAENELIVRVNSPLEEAREDWSLHKRLIKGVLSHHDARPGGAWSDRGQEKNTGGIWAPVTLHASQKLAIHQTKVTPQLKANPQQTTARVDVDLTAFEADAQTIQVKAQLLPANFEGEAGSVFAATQTVTPRDNTLTLEIPQPNPKLWWTWDHGNPNLYTLRLQFWQGDRLLDTTETRFGFRTVEWDKDAQVFRLNGHRMFLRGTNYIPSQWLSELTSAQIQQDIDLMQGAYINSVRVHAHVTHPLFYQQADEAGILIWQDFPLQWGYQDTLAFTAEAIRQGRDMIAQLYNHPSIFTWSLHNEPPWDAFWMEYHYENYNPDQNLQLDRALYRTLRAQDPTRYLHPASVLAEHPWWGWYSFTYGRYGEPTDQPLITEFGAQALPNYASLTRLFDADTLWPETDAEWAEWQYRNFQRRETFEIAKVPIGSNPQELINNTQNYQARLHQYAAEAYRRQRYRPVSAIFQFMFCEPWPSINWGMVDYWRDPKAGYFALQQAYRPILPSIEAPADPQPVGQSFPIKLWAINDTWEDLPDMTLTYVLKQGDRIIKTDTLSFRLEADALKFLTRLEMTPSLPGDYTLFATLEDAQKHPISQNQYTFTAISHV